MKQKTSNYPIISFFSFFSVAGGGGQEKRQKLYHYRSQNRAFLAVSSMAALLSKYGNAASRMLHN